MGHWESRACQDGISLPSHHLHVLILLQCSVFTQYLCLPVKTLNSAWAIKLWCEERQWKLQECSARHTPILQPCEVLLLQGTISYSQSEMNLPQELVCHITATLHTLLYGVLGKLEILIFMGKKKSPTCHDRETG